MKKKRTDDDARTSLPIGIKKDREAEALKIPSPRGEVWCVSLN
jgi:hypothetical protein